MFHPPVQSLEMTTQHNLLSNNLLITAVESLSLCLCSIRRQIRVLPISKERSFYSVFINYCILKLMREIVTILFTCSLKKEFFQTPFPDIFKLTQFHHRRNQLRPLELASLLISQEYELKPCTV